MNIKDLIVAAKLGGGDISHCLSPKDALIATALFGGSEAPPVEVLPVTLAIAGAQTRLRTQLIDARAKDMQVMIPFNAESAYMPEGATLDTMKLGFAGELYEDAEMQINAGNWYNGQINSSWTSTLNEQLPMGSVFEVPKGYYVRIVVFKRAAAFTNNTQFQGYLGENFTSVTLI